MRSIDDLAGARPFSFQILNNCFSVSRRINWRFFQREHSKLSPQLLCDGEASMKRGLFLNVQGSSRSRLEDLTENPKPLSSSLPGNSAADEVLGVPPTAAVACVLTNF